MPAHAFTIVRRILGMDPPRERILMHVPLLFSIFVRSFEIQQFVQSTMHVLYAEQDQRIEYWNEKGKYQAFHLTNTDLT